MEIEVATQLTCPICQKVHNYRSGKTRCIQKHQGIECPICKKKLTAKESLVRHSRGTACERHQIRTTKAKEQKKPNKVGHSPTDIEENLARIAAIRDLYGRTCQVCNRVFQTRSGKTKCMRRHQGPIVCPICSKQFTQVWSLNRHLETACRAITYDSSTTSNPSQVNINTAENERGNASVERGRSDNVNTELASASTSIEHGRNDNLNTENPPGSTNVEHDRNSNVTTENAQGSTNDENARNDSVATDIAAEVTSHEHCSNENNSDVIVPRSIITVHGSNEQEAVTNDIESSNGEPVNINIKVHSIPRTRTVNINIDLNTG